MLVAAALPVIILVAAAGVYLGLRSGKPPSPPSREPAATATVSPPEPTTVTATSDPPVFTPDALPTAQPITTAIPKGAVTHAKGGRTPKGATTAPRPTSNAPGTPSSTPTYGVFE